MDAPCLAAPSLAAIAGMPSPSIGESLALPSVFACIRVLGETVAGLPLITYRETRNGGRGGRQSSALPFAAQGAQSGDDGV